MSNPWDQKSRTISAAVGEQVRQRRLMRGWSLRQLGARVGIGLSQLSKLERGERFVTVDDLVLLCAALEIPSDELLGEYATRTTVAQMLRQLADTMEAA